MDSRNIMRRPASADGSPDFRALFESVPAPYLVLTPDLTIVAVSDAYLRATRTTREGILGRGLFDLFPDNPVDPNASGVGHLRASLDRVRESRASDTMAVQKYDIRRPESEGGGFEERFFSLVNSPVFGTSNALQYIIHRVEDVTGFVRLKQRGSEQEKATEELQSRAEKMEVVRAQEVGVANRQLQKANAGLAAEVAQNETLEEQIRERTQQLIQSEKLAAMGSLLAGVAHELNNPLSVVMGQAALLQLTAGAGPMAERVGKIIKAAERCARIVKNFLALARQQPMERQAVSLNRVVQEAVELLAYPLRVDTVEMALELAPDLPDIWADPHQLHQVVVNLVSNAHQALRTISTPRRLILTTRLDPAARRVLFSVADTGPGISSEVQGRIFEPFFTTKPVGQGTGLGLSLCQGIVERHGGSIRVASQPGHGAVFSIELPIDLRGTATLQAARPASLPPIREKMILIVDDDRDVAETLGDLLQLDGHHVELAGNGAIALEKLHNQTYDLILSDVRMPDTDGPRLHTQLERHHPELLQRVAFLTGDTLSAETREFLERTRVPTIAKPFTLEQVRTLIQQIVRER